MHPRAEPTTTGPLTARRRRWVALIGLFVICGVGLGGVLNGAAAASDPVTDTLKGIEALITPPTTAKPKPRPKTPVQASTRLATPGRDVAVYDGPAGKRVGQAGFWYGHQQSFPILAQQDGWLKIRLPERPNGKTGWIKASNIKITSTPWRIVIKRSTTTLTVYKNGYPQWSSPVGIGTDKTPTPLGSFYVGAIDDDKRPGYGPFQLATTSHSEVIQSWEGSGDAVTAIHGPISNASAKKVGNTGTKISNGCIRMHLQDLERLSHIVVGTPVDFID